MNKYTKRVWEHNVREERRTYKFNHCAPVSDVRQKFSILSHSFHFSHSLTASVPQSVDFATCHSVAMPMLDTLEYPIQ